ncbi:MAG TPA: Ig-like domain-containing protein, partial [Kurthia sp.]
KLTATPNTGDKVGTPTETTVKEAPYNADDHKPTVKQPAEGDKVVTGTGTPGDKIVLTDKDGKKIGEGTVDKDGNFSITPERPLVEGEKLTATPNTGDKVGTPAETTVKEAPYNADAHKPTVKQPAEGDKTIKGTGTPGDKIVLTDKDGKKIGEGTVDKDGNFSITPERPLVEGEKLTATPNTGDKVGTPAETTVKEAPYNADAHKPTVKQPAEGDKTITGTGTPGDKIVLTDKDGKKIGEGTVDKDGNFSITPNRPLKGGEKLTATPNTGDKVGTPTNTTVKEAPYNADAHKPTVKQPTEGDKVVTGTGTPGDKIVLTDKDGKKIGEGTVDKDGNFSITPNRPLKGGEKLTATPNTGDKVGTPTDTTVKKSPYDANSHKPTVKQPTEGEKVIKGTGTPGDKITLTDKDGNVIGEGMIDEDGNFSVKTNRPLKEGEVITITSDDGNGLVTTQEIKVQKLPIDGGSQKPIGPNNQDGIFKPNGPNNQGGFSNPTSPNSIGTITDQIGSNNSGNLPQTGEESGAFKYLLALGSLLIVLAGFMIKPIRRNRKSQ